MNAWLRQLFARLAGRRRPCSAREALVEAHAEAWDLASELLALEERVIGVATRIAGNAARAMGWSGD